MRTGKFDILVGINLLREGLDIPECGLVAILDADKEGFLRSHVSLIQTIGRAARNVDKIFFCMLMKKQNQSVKQLMKQKEGEKNNSYIMRNMEFLPNQLQEKL